MTAAHRTATVLPPPECGITDRLCTQIYKNERDDSQSDVDDDGEGSLRMYTSVILLHLPLLRVTIYPYKKAPQIRSLFFVLHHEPAEGRKPREGVRMSFAIDPIYFSAATFCSL